MKAVIQRVKFASVSVDDKIVGQIDQGLCVLVGAEPDDTGADIDFIATKLATMRIFADENGKTNKSVQDVNGAILLVSQFTLLADCYAGRRPSFTGAGNPEQAKHNFELLVSAVSAQNIPVQTGIFGADMVVNICNEGPATYILESKKR